MEITLEHHVLSIEGTRRFDAKENEQVMLGRGSDLKQLEEKTDE